MTEPALEMAAEVADLLAGEHIDPAEELALPDWDGEEPPAGERRRWRVDTDERAEYALARAAMAAEDARRLLVFHKQRVDQLTQWLDGRLVGIRETEAFFLGAARDYARRLREADPGFRTLPLPSGKLTAHDSRAGVDVVDADEFCTWALAQEHDECVKVEMKPVLAEVAKRYRVEGDRFVSGEGDGVELVPGLVPRPKGWRPEAKPDPMPGES